MKFDKIKRREEEIMRKFIKKTKLLSLLGAALVLCAVLAGCAGSKAEEVDDVTVRVASLKGPTSIGLVKMMKDNDGSYDFSIYTAADEILPLVISGDVDIASIPANVAAVLYQKTEGKVVALDINTLGVLYVVSYDESIAEITQLAGKTVYMTGKGTTPEYAFNHVLSLNGMSTDDLTVEYKSEATEVISALKGDTSAVGILPQPYVTVAQNQLEGLSINISLADEWEDMLTGVTIVSSQFLEEHPSAVSAFLEAQAASVDYVNANVEEMAQAVEEYDIVTAAIAEKAIPYCNLVCIQGDEMKVMLGNYLQVLYEQDASSVGGQMPEDDFYYAQ